MKIINNVERIKNLKKKRCLGYFYIKKDNTDIQFNVSEEEIKKKFDKNIW